MPTSNPTADVKAPGGFSVQRVFGWGPETIVLGIIMCGLVFVVAPGTSGKSAFGAGVGVMAVGFVLLALRFVQRQNRVRVVMFPERNYLEIFSNSELIRRAPFTSLAVVAQDGAITFGRACLLAAGVVVFLIIQPSNVPDAAILRIFALLASLLCAVLLASHLFTRVLHRRLLLPTGEILIPKSEAEQIQRELLLFMIGDRS